MRFHIVEDRKYNFTQRRLQLVLSNKQHQLSFYGGGTDFFIILNKNLPKIYLGLFFSGHLL